MGTNVRDYKLIYKGGPIYSKDYYKYGDYQDKCQKGEKYHPFYVEWEEKIKRRVISNILAVLKLVRQGRMLSKLMPQDFKNLVEELLMEKGWDISDGFDFGNQKNIIVAKKNIIDIGNITCIWLLKKYSSSRKVGLKNVRYLEYLINKANVSKGYIITTGKMSKPSINLIKQNSSRMDYFDSKTLKNFLWL